MPAETAPEPLDTTPGSEIRPFPADVPLAPEALVADVPPRDESIPEKRPQAATAPPPPTLLERGVVAVVTGVLFGAAAARIGAAPDLAAYCVLFAGLVTVSVTDIRVGLVPRVYLYPTLALVAVALVASSGLDGNWRSLLDAAIGGAAAFLVFFAIWWVAPRSMGFGDVRLAGVMGFALGWLGLRQVYLGFVVAFVAGSVFGLVKIAVQGTGRKTSLPFGPALALGAVVGVLFGATLANLWFHA
jgi:leader peptidase (prepilin peptidase)/N-methyltransferase